MTPGLSSATVTVTVGGRRCLLQLGVDEFPRVQAQGLDLTLRLTSVIHPPSGDINSKARAASSLY